MKQKISLLSKKLGEVSPLFLGLYLIFLLSSGYLISSLIKFQDSITTDSEIINVSITSHSREMYYEDIGNFGTEELEIGLSPDFDFISDDSYQKYVDPNISFQNIGYIPPDLRSLSLTHIIDTRGDLRLRNTAAEALEALAEDFYTEVGEKVVVVSSYRSYERQRQIKAGGCPDHLCAKAGYSEHQNGLTVDIWSASTEAYWKSSQRLMRFYDWFYENAHLYGFHNSYQNGVEIDGYAVEPWHWRYLGVELATYLREKEITFAQFFYSEDI